jgi:hypothetical protein
MSSKVASYDINRIRSTRKVMIIIRIRSTRKVMMIFLLIPLLLFPNLLGSIVQVSKLQSSVIVENILALTVTPTINEKVGEASFVPIIWTSEGKALSVDSIFHNGTQIFAGHEWLQEYMEWHNDMRKKYPDKELFENPSAPKVLIVYSCGVGGLNDRVDHHHQMIYGAHRSKRVLLFKWFTTADLPTFVVPNLVNWTVPNYEHPALIPCPRISTHTETFIEPPIATLHNSSQHVALRVTDYYRTNNQKVNPKITDVMHIAWHAFFKPSPLLQSRLDRETADLGLIPGQYHAAHCRVRHPAHFQKRKNIKIDMEGAKYEGKQRTKAIRTATRAIKCTKWISQQEAKKNQGNSSTPTKPTYFYADTEQLVHSAIRHYAPEDNREAELHRTSSENRVVGRFSEESIRHIGDSQEGAIEAYLSTFVDLYIAASAQCVSMGVGNFAYLASRISGTTCRVTHELVTKSLGKAWGMADKKKYVADCPLSIPKT